MAMRRAMAKKGSKRRRFNLRRVRAQGGFSIGALAAADVGAGAMTTGGTNAYRMMSIDVNWSLANLGAAIDDTFEFGVAHSDYTAAEIEECLESQASIDRGDKVVEEQSRRLVRSIGVITPQGTAIAGGGVQFNDGIPVKTRLNWFMSTGDFLNVWVRNGSATIYTTGSSITWIGKMWVKDSV